MAERAGMTGQSPGTVGWALHGIADILAILGGLLSCLMAAIVTVRMARSRRLRPRRDPVRLRHILLSSLLPVERRQRVRRFLHAGSAAAVQGRTRCGGEFAVSHRGEHVHLAALLRCARNAAIGGTDRGVQFLPMVDDAIRYLLHDRPDRRDPVHAHPRPRPGTSRWI